MAEPIVDLLEAEWASISTFAADLDEAQWKTPSALAGWSVQDNLSHIIGTELTLMGEPAPDVDVSHLPHLKSPFAVAMEGWIELRRARTGAEVLAEFDEVVPRRLAQLRAMTDEEMATPSWSPIGEVPYREFMRVRVFDSWMHEQDMRRAVGRPGHESGPVVDKALQSFTDALGFIVGKRGGAPEGASVVFVLEGPTSRVYPVVVEGRARLVETVPDQPTVRITLPFATFVALGGGRWTRDQALADGGVTVEGDADLAAAVLAGMAFTP